MNPFFLILTRGSGLLWGTRKWPKAHRANSWIGLFRPLAYLFRQFLFGRSVCLKPGGRITLAQQPCLDWIQQSIESLRLEVLPISPEVTVESSRLPGGFYGDPADRIIVATVRKENLVLMTQDELIFRIQNRGFCGLFLVSDYFLFFSSTFLDHVEFAKYQSTVALRPSSKFLYLRSKPKSFCALLSSMA